MRVIVEGSGFSWSQSVRADEAGYVNQCVDIDALLRTPGRAMRIERQAGDSVRAEVYAARLREKFPPVRRPWWRRWLTRPWPWRRRSARP